VKQKVLFFFFRLFYADRESPICYMKLLEQGAGGKWAATALQEAQLHGWQTWRY